ncbi:hypothetical protein HDU96_003349 [Phlyctochytrium bullatum]|nr:hypothetical protein HDU96_003349 [Phlyctochytrium bullatum]
MGKTQLGATGNPGKVVAPRELQIVKEICADLQALTISQKKENKLNGFKDLNELQRMTERLKFDDEMKCIEMETVVSIISTGLRRQILRTNVMAHMTDEKEISSTLQQHRDEFLQFIWKRRCQARKDLRALFQVGPGMICRFGDMLADASLEVLNSFEKLNTVRLCRDSINWELCEADDIPYFFTNKIALALPYRTSPAVVAPNRIDVHLPETTRKNVGEGYITHPSHQLQATVLAHPLNAPTIIKKRLTALKYDIGSHTEEYGTIDYNFAVDIVRQLNWKMEMEHMFYFEFTYPVHTQWRVGVKLQFELTDS